MKYYFLILLSFILLFYGCSTTTEMEQGKIEFTYTFPQPEINLKGTIYIREFGKQAYVETKLRDSLPIRFLNLDTTSFSLLSDTFAIREKRTEISIVNAGNFELTGNELGGKFTYTKMGDTLFLGRECDKYSISFEKPSQQGIMIAYGKIPLDVKLYIDGLCKHYSVTKFDEKAQVDEKYFKEPKTIN